MQLTCVNWWMWCILSYFLLYLQAMHYLGIPTTRGTQSVCVGACVRGCICVWVFMYAYTCCPSSTVCSLLFLCDHSWDVCDIRHSCGARYPIRWSPQDGTRHCRQPHSTDLSKVNCWYSHSTFVGVECRDNILFVCYSRTSL